MRLVEACVRGRNLVLGEPERNCGLGRRQRLPLRDERPVDVVPDPQIELVHQASMPLEESGEARIRAAERAPLGIFARCRIRSCGSGILR